MQLKIPLADPYITEEDAIAVAKVVREKRLSQGKYVQEFEGKFAEYIGVKHAVAICNGTAALHTALAAIGVRRDDEVLVPSFSFVATANCVLYQGAKPVFADIDPLTFNLDPDDVEKKITRNTKAIIPVHYAGQSADMDRISEIAKRYDCYVIEDAAEAHGASYKGKKVGSLGNLACFSFYPNKNMTTGEGGMITTNDDELAEKMRMIRSHGQDERYHHVMLGYNYRMSDIHAALGLAQLKRLDWVIGMKVKKARYYHARINEMFGGEILPPYVAPYNTHVYMFYSARLKTQERRYKAILALESKGIETRVSFPCIHLQPLYRGLFGYGMGFLPVTEEVSDTVLCLPMYPHLSQKEQDHVLTALRMC